MCRLSNIMNDSAVVFNIMGRMGDKHNIILDVTLIVIQFILYLCV